MVLTSQFVGDKATDKKRGEATYVAASLDFMVAPTAQNRATLAQACVEHRPGRAEALGVYFAKHSVSQEVPQITVGQDATAVAPAAVTKKPGSLM